MLESLIMKRAEYLESCNMSLSTLSQTGEPPVACSNGSNLYAPPPDHFEYLFNLQEFTVREPLTCLCAGLTHLLGMCLCHVLLTFHGSAKVTFLLHYFLVTQYFKYTLKFSGWLC